MYCDRCNVEFTEGLRYCKWCGQVLADRPRVTSELHACPNCSSPVQPGWIFCKSCGVRLAAPVSDPGRIFCPKCGTAAEASATSCTQCATSLAHEPEQSSHEAHSTSIIGSCPSCGERLDTGSMYCKACGAAVYAQARPFGSSALLCSACNSYSPLGSTACRVCGNPLGAEADGATVTFADKKPSTLPDLAEHLLSSDTQPQDDPDQVNSGANTAVFSTPALGDDATSTLKGGDRGTGLVGEQRGEGAGTNALPGVAGSKSEVPAQTKRVPKTRITTPVEEGDAPQPGSTELPASWPETALIDSPVAANPEPPRRASATRPEFRAEPFSTHEHTATFAEGQPAAEVRATSGFVTAPPDTPPAPPQVQQKKRSGAAIASVVVGLIVLVAAAYVGWTFVSKKGTAQRTTSPVPEPKPDTPAPPPSPPAPVVPTGMVMITTGTYTIGREDGDPLEAPVHPVALAGFYIDRAEVTNAEYAKFVDATKCKPPAYWKGATFPAGLDDYPVIGVSWKDAADYAAWAGKRLPTEAEWEAAARGSDGRKYPWGNEWHGGFANIGVKTAEKAELGRYPSGITEVGKYPQGSSQSGAVDMIGNVWEWVADEIVLYPGSSASLSAAAEGGETRRVIRGGAYDGDQKHDASYRGYQDGSLPYPKVGFRCAKSASSP